MRWRTTTALALLVTLTACGGSGDADPGTGGPTEEPAGSSTGTPTGTPTGGTRDNPTLAEPTEAFLDWSDTGNEAGTPYLKGPAWEA